MSTLFSWLGAQDVRACLNRRAGGSQTGPLPSMLMNGEFTDVIILSNWNDAYKTDGKGDHPSEKECIEAIDWLDASSKAKVTFKHIDLQNPTDLHSVYNYSLNAVENFKLSDDEFDYTYNLSSGTWAMAIAWALISKTRIPGQCMGQGRGRPPENVEIPFDISAELLPNITKQELSKLRDPSIQSVIIEDNEFYKKTVFQSDAMRRVNEQAVLAADHSFPVLLTGEIGTEKSVIAKLIHSNDHNRNKGPFIRFFCGSTASSYDTERVLFGEQGSARYRKMMEEENGQCFFDKAAGGTLYLEDVDLLMPSAQNMLLDKLEQAEQAYIKKSISVSEYPRVIVSTSKPLIEKVEAKLFSEQLYFKLSAAAITVPSLSARSTDVPAIAKSMLDVINSIRANDLSYVSKRFAPSAENFIRSRKWRGNLMELETTIKRAALTTPREIITEEDMFRSLVSLPSGHDDPNDILRRPLGDDLKLRDIMKTVAQHYLNRAKIQSADNPSAAYKLVGLKNNQTFEGWYKKYVEEDRG